MAEYSPPIENLPIFDKLVFLSGDEYITQNQADKRYLRYPNAQGTENLQAINVGGISNFNEEANFNDVLKSKLQLQVIDSTASGAITESVVFANVATGNRIVYILNPNNNSYNKLTQTNDNLMVYGDIIDSVGALTIAPWSSTCNGLRMTQDTVMLGSGGTADNPTHRINTDTTQLLLTSSNLKVDGNITSINASATNRQVTASYYNITDISANLTGTQIYQSVQTCFLDNNAATNGGFTFACNNSSGAQQTPFSVFATTVQSNKNFLINGVGNYLQFPDGTQQFTAATTTTPLVTTIVVNPTNSTPVNVTIPTDCIKFDIAIYGSGGLSTPAIYYPPLGGNPAYTVQCGAGGGGGFAKVTGIYQPKQVTQKVNTLTVTMTTGNGNFTSIVYNGVSLAQVYNGTTTTATFVAGGAGCTTPPVLNTNYGPWFSSNGTQGQAGNDIGSSTTPLNLQGGQNIGGGALVNSQMGVGQSYAAYSSPIASWSATPIGYGGAVITFYK
jgi:hypothetical protein